MNTPIILCEFHIRSGVSSVFFLFTDDVFSQLKACCHVSSASILLIIFSQMAHQIGAAGEAKHLKYRSYSNEQLQTALTLVRSGALSARCASRNFSIPKTTLLDKLRDRVPDRARSGSATTLTKAEESALVNYIVLMSSIGYP